MVLDSDLVRARELFKQLSQAGLDVEVMTFEGFVSPQFDGWGTYYDYHAKKMNLSLIRKDKAMTAIIGVGHTNFKPPTDTFKILPGEGMRRKKLDLKPEKPLENNWFGVNKGGN